MNVIRTYPQPDSPAPHIGPRERALAVFKYLLCLEPEAAIMHPLFAVIVHAFEQSEARGWNMLHKMLEDPKGFSTAPIEPSFCDQITSSTEAFLTKPS